MDSNTPTRFPLSWVGGHQPYFIPQYDYTYMNIYEIKNTYLKKKSLWPENGQEERERRKEL